MNCLYTLNIWEPGYKAQYVTAYFREQFIMACYRWGCNYAEINNVDGTLCHCAKLHGPRLLVGYDKLLYVDADILISDDAPNPFDLCTEDETIYAVTDAQGLNPNPLWESVVYGCGMDQMVKRYPEFRKPTVPEYFNSGMMLFSNTEKLRQAFDEVRKHEDLCGSQPREQTVLNVICHNMLKVHLLPEIWNYVVFGRPMNKQAHMNHFVCGGHMGRHRGME